MRAHLLLLSALLVGCSEYSLQSEARPDDEEQDPEPEAPVQPDEEPAPAPAILVEPSALDFGLLPPECTSDRQAVFVFNVGEADLEVQDIALASNTQAAYRLLATPRVLAPGAHLEVQVDFTPPEDGVFDLTTIQVVSDAPDDPVVEVPLTGVGAEEGMILEHFTQNQTTPVDVLWVVDNSCSMSSKVAALTGAFDAFIDSFVALGLDYQLGVISTDMDDPTHAGQLQGPIITSSHPDPVGAFVSTATLGSDGSADEKPLDAAYAALTSPLIHGVNVGMVRPDTHLAVVVVTDEEDGSAISANAFSSWLNAYQSSPDMASLSAIAGPRSGLFPCINGFFGGSADPAPKLWSVIQQTNGIHVSMCDSDWSALLPQLAYATAGLLTRFPLSNPVTDPYQLLVQIDGVNVPYGAINGFTYDAAANAIELHGSHLAPPGATVSVRYPAVAVCPS